MWWYVMGWKGGRDLIVVVYVISLCYGMVRSEYPKYSLILEYRKYNMIQQRRTHECLYSYPTFTPVQQSEPI